MARVRKQPGTREALLARAPALVTGPERQAGKWSALFGDNLPIAVEIGMGKGRFLSTMARQNPARNFIGMEVVGEVLLDAVKRMERSGGIPANLRLVWGNAAILDGMFAPGEVDRVYLNFSDPWPKRRHRKRRLTHRSFLRLYAQILRPGGEVHFKTDNRLLFEFSLNEFCDCGWRLKNIRLDLYRDLPPDNVPTEYELKYREQGEPIYRLEAVRPELLGPEIEIRNGYTAQDFYHNLN